MTSDDVEQFRRVSGHAAPPQGVRRSPTAVTGRTVVPRTTETGTNTPRDVTAPVTRTHQLQIAAVYVR